jgi:hypothetical protein
MPERKQAGCARGHPKKLVFAGNPSAESIIITPSRLAADGISTIR